MEETGTDLIEVESVPGEVETLGMDRREEDDFSSKPLTERMLYLMQKISEYGYLGRPEVELIYANQTHGYRVLGTLRSKDLIGDFETARLPKKAIYLRPKGYRTLEKFGKLRLKRRFLPQHYKPFIFEHRMACARVGLVLESHPLVRGFMPESLLWERQVKKRQKLCDGEFIYKAPDAEAERVGLEVELTLKNRDKLEESLRALSDREDLAQVWWICGSSTIMGGLKAAVMRNYYWGAAKPRHLFCLMENFMASRHLTRFVDAEGAEYKIDPAGPTLRPLPKQAPVARVEVQPQPQPAPKEEPKSIGLDLEKAVYPDARENKRRELTLHEKQAVLYYDMVRDIAAERAQKAAERRLKRERVIRKLGLYGMWGGYGLGAVAIISLMVQLWPLLMSPWSARRITDWRPLSLTQSAWALNKIKLRSNGNRYKLSFEATSQWPDFCEMTSIEVLTARYRIAGKWDFWKADWIGRGGSLDASVSFKAPRKATGFWLDIAASGKDCGTARYPLEFK
ncbi:MAG TPA: hypothetical protein VNH15_06545 [Elusimicrobiota bacterium]|nr:hypothetical protein [Elusimicrobiota bacterium]